MNLPSSLSSCGLSLALFVAAMAPSCTPLTEQTQGTATTGNNKFGYRGSVTDPAGFTAKPSAAPDGEVARSINPGNSANVTSSGINQTQSPAGAAGSTISQPILPNVSSNPPMPPDAGINPKMSKPLPPPPPPPSSAQTGSTSKPPTSSNIGSSSSTPPPAPASKPKDDYPYGIPVPGKDGLVYSPYDKDAGHVDVRNMKPGALVEDPYSKKYFRVP